MKKVIVDGFELNKDYIDLLLQELKGERVKTVEDLDRYLKNHWYTKDHATKSHLFVCRHGKKRNFAIPFEE